MRWTNHEILQMAMEQSACDATCQAEDFVRHENVIVRSEANERAKKYLALPHVCHLISYGNNVVASICETYRDVVSAFISRFQPERCFETPNLHVLDDAFRKHGYRVCFMAENFLPDVEKLTPLPCPYETRLMGPEDFCGLYTPEWLHALSETRRELDVLGVGAFDDGRLIGLAACSADCDSMWQIGVDVLPDHRRRGVAAALTSRLAAEILARGKVPFYCCAWSNVASARNAVKSGFRPAWIELTVKSAAFVDEMNR